MMPHLHPRYSLPLPDSKFPGALSPCVLATHMRMLLISSGISVLVDLAYVSNVGSIGRDINDKLLDVVVRVKGLMLRLLSDEILLENCRDPTSYSQVLWAAAWSCGEYYLASELTRASRSSIAAQRYAITGGDDRSLFTDCTQSIQVLGGGSVQALPSQHRWSGHLPTGGPPRTVPRENRSTGTGLERYLGEVRLWQ
ncbi:hypothetical protein BS47DRAFT_1349067 [Hydnum rufescens UP504]|uniref:Uncharacterized protein n=1 Tax=Hydnum rufescens UP504 TaxID=1448309 RepID=A0A9P6DSI9_9AGAM|nr:hypothetical protein BS47DRAFT_1349067 [Hydnum rufescens UP504]